MAALAIVALVGIVYFDLGPPLAFNDDYIYSWSARHLATGQLYPRQTALALPQLVIGWLISNLGRAVDLPLQEAAHERRP